MQCRPTCASRTRYPCSEMLMAALRIMAKSWKLLSLSTQEQSAWLWVPMNSSCMQRVSQTRPSRETKSRETREYNPMCVRSESKQSWTMYYLGLQICGKIIKKRQNDKYKIRKKFPMAGSDTIMEEHQKSSKVMVISKNKLYSGYMGIYHYSLKLTNVL